MTSSILYELTQQLNNWGISFTLQKLASHASYAADTTGMSHSPAGLPCIATCSVSCTPLWVFWLRTAYLALPCGPFSYAQRILHSPMGILATQSVRWTPLFLLLLFVATHNSFFFFSFFFLATHSVSCTHLRVFTPRTAYVAFPCGFFGYAQRILHSPVGILATHSVSCTPLCVFLATHCVCCTPMFLCCCFFSYAQRILHSPVGFLGYA